MRLDKGVVGWGSDWPAWSEGGADLPHPIICLGRFPNGNVLLVPFTSKRDRVTAGVRITLDRFPSIYPPLNPDYQECYVCVYDEEGCYLTVGDPKEGGARIGTDSIKISDRVRMHKDEWSLLETAIKQAREAKSGIF